MDPVTAVGIVASAIQFADVGGRTLIASFRLVNSLKDAPKKIRELLHDLRNSIERMDMLQTADKQSPSPFLARSDPTQLRNMRERIDSACQAMKELEELLGPLSSTSKVGRAWKSIVSVSMEKKIIEKLARVERLDREVQAVLQIASMHNDHELKNNLTQIEHSIKVEHRGTKVQLAAINSNVVGSKDTIDQIERATRGLEAEFRRQAAMFQDSIAMLGQRTSLDLVSLRNDILHELVASNNASRDRSGFAPLTASEKNQLGQSIVAQLIQSPDSLRQVCYESSFTAPLEGNDSDARIMLTRRRRQPLRRFSIELPLSKMIGVAVNLTFHAGFGSGGFSIGQTFRCINVVQRSKSPAFRLLDDISRSVSEVPKDCHNDYDYFLAGELGSSTCEYTYNYISMKAQLRRAHDELKRLFQNGSASSADKDEFGNSLLHTLCNLAHILRRREDHLSEELSQLSNLLIDSGVDLHATSSKIVSGSIRPTFAVKPETLELQNHMTFTAADMLLCSIQDEWQIDPLLSRMPRYLLPPLLDEILLGQYVEPFPELKRADDFGFNLRTLRHMPFLLDHLNFTNFEQAIFRRDLQQTKSLYLKNQHRLGTVLNTGFDIGPMELAVGWESGLRLLVQSGTVRFQSVIAALSQGDTRSLEILLTEHEIQTEEGDAWHRVLVHIGFCFVFRRASMRTTDLELATKLIVETLKRQRQKLRNFASEMLSESKLVEIGAFEEEVLDGAAAAVYEALLETGTELPATLNPALGSACSTYHTLHLPKEIATRCLADSLFDIGFRSIDYSGWVEYDSSFHESALYERFFPRCILDLKWHSGMWRWLLEKGATVTFPLSKNLPNLLHGLATYFRAQLGQGQYPSQYRTLEGLKDQDGDRDEEGDRDGEEERDELFKYLMRRCMKECSALSLDSCLCYCSPDGCTTVNKLWYCNSLLHLESSAPRYCESLKRETLSKGLTAWLRFCNVPEDRYAKCYQSVCRLELFDRLGMKHICCSRRQWPGKEMWEEMKGSELEKGQEDQQELRDEDAHSKRQLDLLLQAYEAYRLSHDADTCWETWWHKVDEILPELSPAKRCRYLCMQGLAWDEKPCNDENEEALALARANQERADQEREALAACGYSGLDFIEVVRLHFADYLDQSVEGTAA